MFPNQTYDMNIMINNYKQLIINVIDEIIEIELSKFNKYEFMQYQFMNPQIIIEKKLQLYKAKYEKLTEEKVLEKNMSPINYNNGSMNPGNSQINNMNMNMNNMNMNNMNMNNMNMMNNMIMNMMNNMNMNNMNNMNMNNINVMNNKFDQGKLNTVKYLTLQFQCVGDDIKKINIQCKSNDISKVPINNYLSKIQKTNINDYEFLFNGRKVDLNLNVEDNGINEQNRLIIVKKKSQNSFENNIIEQNQNNNYINEFKDKFSPNENFKYNPMENEYKINLLFMHSKGQRYIIVISHNETFCSAVKEFCKMMGLSFDELKKNKDKIHFLYNAYKLDIEDSRTLAQIFQHSTITIISVIDNDNIIGA